MNVTLCHIKFGILAKLSPLLHELEAAPGTRFAHHVILPSYNNDAAYLTARFPHVVFHFLELKSREMSGNQNPLLKLVRYAEFLLKASKTAAGIRADIFAAHDITAMGPAVRAAKKQGAAVVYRAHELFSEAGREISPLPRLWNIVERHYVKSCDFIVVPEPHRAEIYRNEYGAKRLPAVVRNIPPLRGAYAKTTFLRERLALGEDAVLCLYQGLVTRSRCVEELIRAFAYLEERYHLVVIGNVIEDYLNILHATVQECSLNIRVHFMEFIPPEKLPEVTASADIGCLLYRNENRNNYYAAPNKLYEYLFAGLPVVTSNFPSLIAPVEAHSAGAWADPENPEAIASAIESAARIPGGEALAARMRKEFRWEDEFEKLNAVYNEALTTGRHDI